MEDNMEDFDFDDRDQELIDALTGNLGEQDNDPCGSDENNSEDEDGQGDRIEDGGDLDLDWNNDGCIDDDGCIDNDGHMIFGNMVGDLSPAVENDNNIIKFIKEEITATKAKLNQLEIKLAKAESKKSVKEQQSICDSDNDAVMSYTGAVTLKKRKETSDEGSNPKQPLTNSTNAVEQLKANGVEKLREKKMDCKEKKNCQLLSDQQEMEDKKENYKNDYMKNGTVARKSENIENVFKKKDRLAHMPKHEPKLDRSRIDDVNLEKRKVNIDHKQKPNQQLKEDDRPWRTEAYSGIRIINPCISSTQMDARMEERRFIKLNTIPRFIVKNEISGDWVTMGVVVAKLPPKTAANGKTFSIWKLSDLVLGHENETTSLFLFGNVYKEHWKTSEGTAIALLNSSIMPQRDNDAVGQVAITIDNSKKLMIMGISKDFGKCKGVTRKGNHCACIVNKMHGEYCEYHVAREHKKIMAGRMEFQSSSTGPDLKKGKRMQAVKKDICSGQVCYAGRTLTWNDKGKTKQTADKKKSILTTIVGAPSNRSSNSKEEGVVLMSKGTSNTDDEILSQDFKSRLKVPTLGSRNLLKFLKQDEEIENQKKNIVKPVLKSAKDLISEQKEQVKRSVKSISLNLPLKSTIRKPDQKFDSNFKPTIGGNLFDDDFIDFGDSDDIVSDALNAKSPCINIDPPKMIMNSHRRRSIADGNNSKLKAINMIRSNKIKISKNASAVNNKEKSPRKFQKIKERVIKDISNKDNAEPPSKKRKGILGDIFGEIDLESKEGKKLIAMKSENNHLVQSAELEREKAYFNVLEKKEMYEEKMQSVMELKVTAICCKTCKYMHEFQSSYCKDQGHGIVRVDAVKRFFICKSCKNRTTSFKRFPVQPCSNCGSNNFEKTSMFQEKKGPKIGGETLLVRGEEHSMYLNSLK